jgi:hypothetical protein
MWVFSVTTVLPATWTLNKTSALGNGEKFGDSKRALIVLFFVFAVLLLRDSGDVGKERGWLGEKGVGM